jgi:hypothetical protein
MINSYQTVSYHKEVKFVRFFFNIVSKLVHYQKQGLSYAIIGIWFGFGTSYV